MIAAKVMFCLLSSWCIAVRSRFPRDSRGAGGLIGSGRAGSGILGGGDACVGNSRPSAQRSSLLICRLGIDLLEEGCHQNNGLATDISNALIRQTTVTTTSSNSLH